MLTRSITSLRACSPSHPALALHSPCDLPLTASSEATSLASAAAHLANVSLTYVCWAFCRAGERGGNRGTEKDRQMEMEEQERGGGQGPFRTESQCGRERVNQNRQSNSSQAHKSLTNLRRCNLPPSPSWRLLVPLSSPCWHTPPLRSG